MRGFIRHDTADGDPVYVYHNQYFSTAAAMEKHVMDNLPGDIISLLGLTK